MFRETGCIGLLKDVECKHNHSLGKKEGILAPTSAGCADQIGQKGRMCALMPVKRKHYLRGKRYKGLKRNQEQNKGQNGGVMTMGSRCTNIKTKKWKRSPPGHGIGRNRRKAERRREIAVR